MGVQVEVVEGIRNKQTRGLTMELRAHKYRIYPNKEQITLLEKSFGCARFIYNNSLAYSKEEYEKGNKTNINDWSKRLTQLKKQEEFIWLNEVSAVALQQSLRRLDKAFKNFFKSGFGYPKFKSKRDNQSITLVGEGFRFNKETKELRMPKSKQPLKIKWSRDFKGEPSSVTISKTKTGKYYISILTEEIITPLPKTDKTVGIDLGIKHLAICSDGLTFDNPKATDKYAKKLKREQQKLSRKVKGSNNYNKQRLRVAKVHEKISNTRMDFTHKMTNKLINDNQVICLESLRIKKMVKNKQLAKHISDANFGEIARQLEYKANWYGRTLVKIDTWFPSSKMCSSCGVIYKGKWNLSIRKWTCDCGEVHDRDFNASKNIHKEGLRILSELKVA